MRPHEGKRDGSPLVGRIPSPHPTDATQPVSRNSLVRQRHSSALRHQATRIRERDKYGKNMRVSGCPTMTLEENWSTLKHRKTEDYKNNIEKCGCRVSTRVTVAGRRMAAPARAAAASALDSGRTRPTPRLCLSHQSLPLSHARPPNPRSLRCSLAHSSSISLVFSPAHSSSIARSFSLPLPCTFVLSPTPSLFPSPITLSLVHGLWSPHYSTEHKHSALPPTVQRRDGHPHRRDRSFEISPHTHTHTHGRHTRTRTHTQYTHTRTHTHASVVHDFFCATRSPVTAVSTVYALVTCVATIQRTCTLYFAIRSHFGCVRDREL